LQKTAVAIGIWSLLVRIEKAGGGTSVCWRSALGYPRELRGPE